MRGTTIPNSAAGHYIGNSANVTAIRQLDAALAIVLNKPSSEFKMVISGGDRYKDANGAVLSRTTNKVVPNSSTQSGHLASRSTDISLTRSSPEVTAEKLKEAADLVKQDGSEKSKFSDVKDETDHVHISIYDEVREQGTYDYNSKPFKDDNK